MSHTIWFTADTHFGHNNIIKYCERPFATIEEHDVVLMNNWNSVVKGGDTVYHLGDFGFLTERILPRLHGNIHLIRGNHDSVELQKHRRWNFVKDVHRMKKDGCIFFLSHYAHRSWPQMNHGAIHLFGHSHGNLPDFGRSTDVGVDRWNYTPVSIDQIIQKMKATTPVWESGEPIQLKTNEDNITDN